jgi:HlyD family secretion protein
VLAQVASTLRDAPKQELRPRDLCPPSLTIRYPQAKRPRHETVRFLSACVICTVVLSLVLGVPRLARAQDEAANPSQSEATKEDKPVDDEAAAEDEPGEGQEESAEAAEKSEPETVKLEGLFQAVHSDTIRIDVEEWSNLAVIETAEHGAKVQAGDTLIKLETDKLERAIEDALRELATDELALADAQVKLELAKRSQDLALKAAAAADQAATDDLKDFVTVGRDQRIASLERSAISARNRLEYQAEELKQLEQMYAADDLTEETEEIILKRTRDAVDSAKYSLEVVLDSQRKGLEFDLPRNQEQLEQAVARAALALEEARRTAPQGLQRQELQVAGQRESLARKKEKLERLREDLKNLNITAPRSGIVYYGTPRRGKWGDPSSIESMLQPGGTPKARTDLMTVVQLRPMTVRVTASETSLRHVAPGTEVTIAPAAFPDQKLAGRVVSRSAIPIAAGQFDATVELDDATIPSELVPGMKAEVTVAVKTEPKE